MPEPHLRAADADREAVAATLGEHMAAGRLTVAEYDERLARAYAAKTYGELAELTADLPGPAPHPAPAAAPARAPETARPEGVIPHGTGGHDEQNSWRAWLTTSLIVVTIWAATSLASWEFHYFWPIWVIGPWGAVLLAQRLTGGGDRKDGRRQLGG
jgi:hypothetical protein